MRSEWTGQDRTDNKELLVYNELSQVQVFIVCQFQHFEGSNNLWGHTETKCHNDVNVWKTFLSLI